MANTAKALFRGAATVYTNPATTLYTTPSLTTTVVTNIFVTNTAVAGGTYSIGLDGIPLVSVLEIPGNSVVSLDLKQVLAAGDTITGNANSTDIKFHISGMEIA
jgi:hypothetical protein